MFYIRNVFLFDLKVEVVVYFDQVLMNKKDV